MASPCEKCSDGCRAIYDCDGCGAILCDRCWKEHNSVHFTDVNDDHQCCCDDCIEDLIKENGNED